MPPLLLSLQLLNISATWKHVWRNSFIGVWTVSRGIAADNYINTIIILLYVQSYVIIPGQAKFQTAQMLNRFLYNMKGLTE